MRLAHVVVTMVTRDDLADGGADHIAATVRALRESVPSATVEVLTSDLGGVAENVHTVCESSPDVFNHNLETVGRLYPSVRPEADLERSLGVLAEVRSWSERDGSRGAIPTKSGLMLGLGEEQAEVLDVLRELRRVGCEMLTLGQYLRPSEAHLPVAEFVEPSVFEEIAREARRMGFAHVASAPFVRSSYHAHEMLAD
jgi:lipoic acid synthetase